MLYFDTLIFKFTSVDALVASPIWVYYIATLQVKTLVNNTNLSLFVEQILTSLTCAQHSKVFNSFWEILLEKLNHNPTFLIPSLINLPNL